MRSRVPYESEDSSPSPRREESSEKKRKPPSHLFRPVMLTYYAEGNSVELGGFVRRKINVAFVNVGTCPANYAPGPENLLLQYAPSPRTVL